MPPSKKPAPVLDYPGSLDEMLAVSQSIDLSLLESIADTAWSSTPPQGKSRSLAQLFAHIHNVRVMWLVAQKVSDPPAKLEAEGLTKAMVRKALEGSASALRDVVRAAAATPEGRVRDFKPNVAHFVAYLISHEAHHRGQITQLARSLGHAVDQKTMFGMWAWSTHRSTAGLED